jgi:DNA-cytosine methyltransferase
MLTATNQPQEISYVDLFCGVGGLTHGFVREGLQVNVGIDIDPACRYPYEKNNDVTFVRTDVGRISSSEIRKMFTPSAFKVLAGCAPCQPFSTYSQRYDITGDPRWDLLNSFARHVVGIQPDIVTRENVPSVIQHKVFQDFVDTLEAVGYSVHSQIVNCVDYGVAQTRKRLILLIPARNDSFGKGLRRATESNNPPRESEWQHVLQILYTKLEKSFLPHPFWMGRQYLEINFRGFEGGRIN